MIKDIIKDVRQLSKPCLPIESDDELIQILQDLQDTLSGKDGYGLAANQIGYNKQVAIIRMQGGAMINLVNPVIVEKEGKFRFGRESCLSFPGVYVDTSRWYKIKVQSGVKGEDEYDLTALEAVVAQHEISHLRGQTIFDMKYKKR